jgi:hypothetical protein
MWSVLELPAEGMSSSSVRVWEVPGRIFTRMGLPEEWACETGVTESCGPVLQAPGLCNSVRQ